MRGKLARRELARARAPPRTRLRIRHRSQLGARHRHRRHSQRCQIDRRARVEDVRENNDDDGRKSGGDERADWARAARARKRRNVRAIVQSTGAAACSHLSSRPRAALVVRPTVTVAATAAAAATAAVTAAFDTDDRDLVRYENAQLADCGRRERAFGSERADRCRHYRAAHNQRARDRRAVRA